MTPIEFRFWRHACNHDAMATCARPDLEHEAEYANRQSAQGTPTCTPSSGTVCMHALLEQCWRWTDFGDAMKQLGMQEEHRDVHTCVWQYSSASTVSAM